MKSLKGRILTGVIFIVASSVVASGCGCDDIGCVPLQVTVSPDWIVTTGAKLAVARIEVHSP